jgi:hypothetical protein
MGLALYPSGVRSSEVLGCATTVLRPFDLSGFHGDEARPGNWRELGASHGRPKPKFRPKDCSVQALALLANERKLSKDYQCIAGIFPVARATIGVGALRLGVPRLFPVQSKRKVLVGSMQALGDRYG